MIRRQEATFAELLWPTPTAVLTWVSVWIGIAAFGWLVLDSGWLNPPITTFAWLFALSQTNNHTIRITGSDRRLKTLKLVDARAVDVLDAAATKSARRRFPNFSQACWCPGWMRSSVLVHTRSPEGLDGRVLIGTRNVDALVNYLQGGTLSRVHAEAPRSPGVVPFRTIGGFHIRSGAVILHVVFAVIVLAPLVVDPEPLVSAVLGLPILAANVWSVWRPVEVTEDTLRVGLKRVPMRELRSARVAPHWELAYLSGATRLRRAFGSVYVGFWAPQVGLVIATEDRVLLIGAKDAQGVAAAVRAVRPELFAEGVR